MTVSSAGSPRGSLVAITLAVSPIRSGPAAVDASTVSTTVNVALAWAAKSPTSQVPRGPSGGVID